MEVTQKYINELSYKIIGCAINVHKELGSGLLESVYEACFIEELRQNEFTVTSQQRVPIIWRGKELSHELRLDIVVNNIIVVELKAVETMIPLFKAQLLSYLKLSQKAKGLLINFNCENIRSQMVSLVTADFAKLPKE